MPCEHDPPPFTVYTIVVSCGSASVYLRPQFVLLGFVQPSCSFQPQIFRGGQVHPLCRPSQPQHPWHFSRLSLLAWSCPVLWGVLSCIPGLWSFPAGSDGKESACNAGDSGSIPESGKFPGERDWLWTLVFLPGEFHGQRSLADYSPWGCKESDVTE